MTARLYRLVPWLVRATVPPGLAGAYSLVKDDQLVYVGRSDTCLRRRLLEQARAERADYFLPSPHHSIESAFTAECMNWHATPDALENRIHPALPAMADPMVCPYCASTIALTKTLRTQVEQHTVRTAPAHDRRRAHQAAVP